MKNFIIAIILFFLSQKCLLAGTVTVDYHVVPLPQSVTLTQEKPFVLDENTQIFYADNDTQMKRNAEFLARYIKEMTGYDLPIVTNKQKHTSTINLILNSKINYSRYKLLVNVKGITIEGGVAGVFYGIQTLRKSLPVISRPESITMPAVVIEDEPRFTYRGMMLDCARHFFSVEFVKEFIDLLALHNMNVFHWHLTDDQGWRIEIKAYPQLTKFGSMRSGTVIGNNSDVDDETPYGGYYTQDEAREIVKYARERYISVIPEIDMPGHTMAALATFPELGCTGGSYQVGHKWGIYNDVLCVGNEKSYEFVKNVLDEIVEIFPSEYIHIGGDETPTVRWDKCPKCQSRMAQLVQFNGTKMTLQGYFTKEIESYLTQKGRRIIGWDEMLSSEIAQTTIIMGWRGMKAGIKAAQMGHDVVLSPLTHCYFDYYQTEKKNYEPSITGMWAIDVKKVYDLQPVPDSLSTEAKKHILGVQANLWTEYIATKKVAEYMMLPRLAAIAEVQWTAENKKDFESFKTRITRLTTIYDKYGWKYALHLWPERTVKDRWHN